MQAACTTPGGDEREGREVGGGEVDAGFEEFVRSSGPRLLRTAYLVAGDLHHAQDLLQAAYERTYRHWRRVSAMEHREAYVRRTMVNLTADRWRRSRFVVETPLEDAPVMAVEDGTREVDERDGLVRGLLALPPRMRAVVVLRYWEGLSEAETAAEMGCSTGSVKSQASRGLARLREVLVARPVGVGREG